MRKGVDLCYSDMSINSSVKLLWSIPIFRSALKKKKEERKKKENTHFSSRGNAKSTEVKKANKQQQKNNKGKARFLTSSPLQMLFPEELPNKPPACQS